MEYLFKKNPPVEKQLSYLNDSVFRRNVGAKAVKGEIGVEVECEGERLAPPPLGWTTHVDGSLRGSACEYVFNGPKNIEQSHSAIEDLFAAFNSNNTKLYDSIRTSVHVHLNVSAFNYRQYISFCVLWYTFENLLVKWCGNDREGNRFCLRAKDADVTSPLIKLIKTGYLPKNDNLKYCGLNYQATGKYGSIEVRTLRGCTSAEPIHFWLDTLYRMYTKAESMTDPRRVCGDFSALGPVGFMINIFGKRIAEKIVEDTELTEEDVNKLLYEGVRHAQDLAYAIDWSSVSVDEPVDNKYSPKKKLTNIEEALRQVNAPRWHPGLAEGDMEELDPRLNQFEVYMGQLGGNGVALNRGV